MAFLETVRHWHEGVVAFEENRLQDSLLSFNHIADPSARIQFNLARVLQRFGKDTECIMHLGEALKKDPHLAVAYFCRSVQLLKMKRYDEALDDLDKAELSLRGATYINYSQLGLDFTLYKFEIQFNRALCVAKKGDIRSAVHMLIEAGKTAEEEVHSRISVQTIQDLTLVRQDGSKGKFPSSFTEFEIPEKSIFQPSKDMVANLEKKQYVAKAKVISRYGDGKIPKEKQVITRGSEFLDNKQSEPVISYHTDTRTPPLPRRPLPPPPSTGMIASKSAENIVTEVKEEGVSRRKSLDMDLTSALNARFKNLNRNLDSSYTYPRKPPVNPARPPRRPPPPDPKSLTRKPHNPTVPSGAKILPIQSSEYEDPVEHAPSIPPNSTTRNIPPPPSYRPPPPPPTFRPPSPPISERHDVPPLPRKKAHKS